MDINFPIDLFCMAVLIQEISCVWQGFTWISNSPSFLHGRLDPRDKLLEMEVMLSLTFLICAICCYSATLLAMFLNENPA